MFTQTTDAHNCSKSQYTVSIVINPIALFQTVFSNKAKTEKEDRILILDQNHLWNQLTYILMHTRSESIQLNKLHPNL